MNREPQDLETSMLEHIQRIIHASNAADYDRFTENFNDTLRARYTRDSFLKKCETVPMLTRLHQPRELLAVLPRPSGYLALWKQTSDVFDGVLLGMLELEDTGNGLLISHVAIN